MQRTEQHKTANREKKNVDEYHTTSDLCFACISPFSCASSAAPSLLWAFLLPSHVSPKSTHTSTRFKQCRRTTAVKAHHTALSVVLRDRADKHTQKKKKKQIKKEHKEEKPYSLVFLPPLPSFCFHFFFFAQHTTQHLRYRREKRKRTKKKKKSRLNGESKRILSKSNIQKTIIII
jgi:hypothetical protein